jgi:hypothetical protein
MAGGTRPAESAAEQLGQDRTEVARVTKATPVPRKSPVYGAETPRRCKPIEKSCEAAPGAPSKVSNRDSNRGSLDRHQKKQRFL